MKILITGGCGFVGSNLAVLFKQYYTKDFKRFIEPFIGGAAVYFDLNFVNFH